MNVSITFEKTSNQFNKSSDVSKLLVKKNDSWNYEEFVVDKTFFALTFLFDWNSSHLKNHLSSAGVVQLHSIDAVDLRLRFPC